MLPSSLLDDLAWRGLIQDNTGLEQLREHLDSAQRRFYIGFDPSSESLTIGNLLPMVLIMRGARAGLRPVVLLGGATGLIGDPSGKSSERRLLPLEEARANAEQHQKLMQGIFERALTPEQMPQFVNNIDWFGGMGALDFLRDIGKHFPVAEIMRRDSVQRRLADTEQGLSYTEFSYSLLQAYDFRHLYEQGVTIQLGASDQWGNLVAGIDYIRRTLRQVAHAITCPLLLRSDGTKFGKTEKGAIWISANRTSPWELYQFLFNLSDDEAKKFALFFSLATRERLEPLFTDHVAAPSERGLQTHIAGEITTLLHGEGVCRRIEVASQSLFSGNVRAIEPDLFEQIFTSVPSIGLSLEQLEGSGLEILEAVTATQLAPSKTEGRKLITKNAISVNGEVVGGDFKLTRVNLLHGSLILLRRGKREWRVLRFT